MAIYPEVTTLQLRVAHCFPS